MGRPGQADRMMGSTGHLRGGGPGPGRAPAPSVTERRRWSRRPLRAQGAVGAERAGGGGRSPRCPGLCRAPAEGPGRALWVRGSAWPRGRLPARRRRAGDISLVSAVRAFWLAKLERRVRRTGLRRCVL